MSLSLSDLYSPQAQALSAVRKPYRVPLASIIHSELPAKIEAGRAKAETGLAEKGLGLQQRSIEQAKEASAAELEISKHDLALTKEQLEAEKKAASTASKIQLGGLAAQTGIGLAQLYTEYPAIQQGVSSAATYLSQSASSLFRTIFGAGAGSGVVSGFSHIM